MPEKARIQYLFIPLLSLLTACPAALVEESYASLGDKSINGADVLYSMLEKSGRKITKTAYLTKEARTADVIVHFEQEPAYEEAVYRNLENWMAGLEFQTPELTEKDQKVFQNRSRITLASAKREIDSNKLNKKDSSIKRSDTPLHSAERETNLTILYFLKDSDASIEFWQKLAKQFPKGTKEGDYCDSELQYREEIDKQNPQEGATFFGYKKRGPTLRLASDLESDVFEPVPSHFPFRVLHSDEPSAEDIPFTYSSLLIGEGMGLIRQFDLKRGRIILVYNTEPFLNYSMARKEQRAFAQSVVDYAVSLAPADGTISYIEKMPVSPSEPADKEENPFRVFTVFPLNVIFFQLLIFLLVFLLSRSISDRPPRGIRTEGSRDFTEHFKAVGHLIQKSARKKTK